ncbi:Rv1733c family protein [Mycobacterium vicinigordonae]|uniref:Uncharacterized protein n=1 Tax=Mycobacterium vicinigordonae TaxID=1719132 RepID=A0A7D6I445_9MYCO|nr:hypothetical protein [Mycobacterium vicinigordonae]QLL09494.1 hypothetical protein H0P51_11835 [Mycobacterium vicinigordonae]
MRSPIALLLVLIAVSAAMITGVSVYDARADFYAEQAHNRRQVTATVVSTAPRHRDLDSPLAAVPARWSAAGSEHSGAVVTNRSAKTGDTIHIWVDDTGQVVNPSATTALDEAVMTALGVGLAVFVAGVSVLGIARLALAGIQHQK